MKSPILLLLTLTSTVLSAESKAGWSGTLSTLDGGLEGVVAVPSTDDNTLTITNYKLEDASAPALYWWGSASSSLKDGFRISEKQVNEPSGDTNTYTISLDAGKTTDDFVTVGLWCETFGVNFGQATLAPSDGEQTEGDESEGGAATPTSSSGGETSGKTNGGVAGRVEWIWVGVAGGMSAFAFMLL